MIAIGQRIIIPSLFITKKEELNSINLDCAKYNRIQIDICDYNWTTNTVNLAEIEKTEFADTLIMNKVKIDWHLMSADYLEHIEKIANSNLAILTNTLILQIDERAIEPNNSIKIFNNLRKIYPELGLGFSFNPGIATSTLVSCCQLKPSYIQLMGYDAGIRGQNVKHKALSNTFFDVKSFLRHNKFDVELSIEGGVDKKLILEYLEKDREKLITSFGINIKRLVDLE